MGSRKFKIASEGSITPFCKSFPQNQCSQTNKYKEPQPTGDILFSEILIYEPPTLTCN